MTASWRSAAMACDGIARQIGQDAEELLGIRVDLELVLHGVEEVEMPASLSAPSDRIHLAIDDACAA
jgi:hypothetical protein